MAIIEKKEWYLEYRITLNRPGLLEMYQAFSVCSASALLRLMVWIKAREAC